MRILDSGATSYYLPHHRTLSDSAHANNGAATGDYHADIHARPSKRYNVLRRLKIIDYLCYNQISKCLVAARQRDPSSRSGFKWSVAARQCDPSNRSRLKSQSLAF